MKDEHGVLLADSHNISNRWKKTFCQLLYVNGVNDVKQTKIHTGEPLVPSLESSSMYITLYTVRNNLLHFIKYSLHKRSL